MADLVLRRCQRGNRLSDDKPVLSVKSLQDCVVDFENSHCYFYSSFIKFAGDEKSCCVYRCYSGRITGF